MTLRDAIYYMYTAGRKVCLPEWKGYWYVDQGKIFVHTKDGEIKDTPWFKEYADRTDWRIYG